MVHSNISMCGCVLGIQLTANVYLDTFQCSGIEKNHFNVFILQECLNICCCHHAVHVLHSVIASAAIWKRFPLVSILLALFHYWLKNLNNCCFLWSYASCFVYSKSCTWQSFFFCNFHSSRFRSFRPFCKLGKDNSTNLASVWEPPTLSSKLHNCFHSN